MSEVEKIAEELASKFKCLNEIDKEFLCEIPLDGNYNFMALARYVQRKVLVEKISSLSVAMGKLVLSAYHAGRPADVDWHKHEIERLEDELAKLEDSK